MRPRNVAGGSSVARNTVPFDFNRALASVDTFLSSNAFIILFLFIYINAVMLMFFWGARDQYVNMGDHPMRLYITIARAFGYTLNFNTALVILIASRLLLTFIRDTWLNLFLPFDKFFPAFHIIIAVAIAVAVLCHATFHFIWIIQWKMWTPGPFAINMTVATGIALTFILIVMIITSLPAIRSTRFQLFHTSHMIGATLFYALLFVHGVYNAKPYTFKWITAPIIVYLVDRITRNVKMHTCAVNLNRDNSTLKSASVVRIDIPKQFNYRAGQYAEIKVPSINRREWHPFTIASAPIEPIMSFYIKALGDWTKALRTELEKREAQADFLPLEVWIRGPFGAPAQHVDGYQRLVLISGGIGATPFASVCKHVFFSIRELKDTEKSGSSVSSESIDPSMDSLAWMRKEVMRSVGNVYGQGNDFECLLDLQYDESVAEFSPVQSDSREGIAARGSKKLVRTGPSRQDDDALQQTFGKSPQKIFDNRVPRKPRGSGDLSSPSSFVSRALNIDAAIVGSILRCLKNIAPNVRMLRVLRSIAMNMVLCLILVIRVALIAYVDLYYSSQRSGAFSLPDASAEMVWMTGVDLVLGCIMSVTVGVTVAVEISVYGRSFFHSGGRIVDLTLLFPFTVLSNVMAVYMLGQKSGEDMSVALSVVHFVTIMTGLFALLLYRLGRVIGSRVLLAERYRTSPFDMVRAVDFLWTTPMDEDDEWLRDELGDLANGKELRLHRYVTRATEEYLEHGFSPEKGMTTNIGRPKWVDVFMRIAEEARTGSKVGVFFCGPEGMARAVQQALTKVQTMTTMRGVYLSTNDMKLRKQLGVGFETDLRKLRERGSNIRFILRKENFG